jgi:hypothetical protein
MESGYSTLRRLSSIEENGSILSKLLKTSYVTNVDPAMRFVLTLHAAVFMLTPELQSIPLPMQILQISRYSFRNRHLRTGVSY